MNNRVDIQFKGLTTSPSDYACSDGELAICHNLVNEGGELRPVAALKKLCRFFPSTIKLVHLHKTETGTSIIVYETNQKVLMYSSEKGLEGTYTPSKFVQLLDGNYDEITTVGNMLIVTQAGVDNYFIKKGLEYVSLGPELPSLPQIAFGMHTVSGGGDTASVLRREYRELSTFHVDSTDLDVGYTSSSTYLSPSSDSGQTLYNALMGALGAVEKEAKRMGGFVSPFFVRFAYRLKDHGESLARMSPPVLMTPRTTPSQIAVQAIEDNKVRITAPRELAFLRYCVMRAPDYSEWEDIIDSIEVFVSSPIKTYNNLEFVEYEAWRSRLPQYNRRSPSMCMHISTGYPHLGKIYGCNDVVSRGFSGTPSYKIDEEGNIEYTKFDITEETGSAAPDASSPFNGLFVAPYKSPEDLSGEMASTASFYHVATIPIGDIKPSDYNFKRVPIENGALIALENRETLKEDYLSNYRVNASSHRVYNRRLIKVGASRDITTNFALTTMEQYLYHGSRFGAPRCAVLLKKKNVEYLVDLGSSHMPVDFRSQWLFYPDPDATELRFYASSPMAGEAYSTVPLSRHEYLQGAYWIPSDTTENFAMGVFSSVHSSDAPPDPTSDATNVPIKGMVYVSEVDNPFFFPSGLTAQLGNGTVMALAATTLPISEGQQGEFPLMAFTDEGVWALSVSSEGSIHATNPMLRDVLLSKDSVCPLKDGVAYTTSKGIMILRGGHSVCISDSIIDAMIGVSTVAPHISSLLEDDSTSVPTHFHLRRHLPFVKLLYSDQDNRLLAIGKDDLAWSSTFALIYSIETGLWSTMDFPYTLPVESYPTVYVQREETDDSSDTKFTVVYDLGDAEITEEDGKPKPQGGGVVLTRPLSFGVRDVPKTLMEIVVRGVFDRWIEKVPVLPPAPRSIGTLPGGGGSNVGGDTGGAEPPMRDVVACDVNAVLYGSNDLSHWFAVSSSRDQHIRGRFGTPYKFYRLLVTAPKGLDRQKSISGASFDVQPRLNNTLR